jgi:hypothetical protein
VRFGRFGIHALGAVTGRLKSRRASDQAKWMKEVTGAFLANRVRRSNFQPTRGLRIAERLADKACVFDSRVRELELAHAAMARVEESAPKNSRQPGRSVAEIA